MKPSGPPETRREMERCEYEFKGTTKCRFCPKKIEWWKTSKGKFIPIDVPSTQHPMDERTQIHDCRDDSKAATKPAVTHRRELTMEEEQRRAIDLLGSQLKARVLLAVMPDGTFRYSAERGIPPEDLRHELITAANNMKRELEAQHGTC